jgi:hypothetical protein
LVAEILSLIPGTNEGNLCHFCFPRVVFAHRKIGEILECTSVQSSNTSISDFIYYMSNSYFIMTLPVMCVHAVCIKMLITFIPMYIFSSLSHVLIGHSLYKLLYLILNFLPLSPFNSHLNVIQFL